MLTIGVDAHKGVHVAVAVDEAGREVARWRGPNSVEGWRQLAAWAAGLGDTCRWGIEGAWNYGRGLAQHLVEAGTAVYEVNPRWTAAGRRAARRRDKSDRLDARAVALLVWREAASLPAVAAEDDTAVLELLVTEREGALAEATRLRNQLHQLLLQLDPEYTRHLPALTSQAGLRAVEGYTSADGGAVQQQRAAAVRRLAQRLRLALAQAKALAAQIGALAARHCAPLTERCGVGLLTAGALAGILGPGRRFGSDAQLAAYAGVAPLEASSAERVRHRLNRTGNRRRNAILHRIALTQARCSPAARAYLERRVREGKTRREAVRALKRFLARAIWRQWQRCLPDTAAPLAAAA
jgi:transposase